MVDIVIDLETLGTRPGCPIIEIGACVVDRNTGKITANFSRRVSGTYCYGDVLRVAEGSGCFGGVDRDTAAWWTMDAGRNDTLKRILSLRYIPSCDIDALISLFDWFNFWTAGINPEMVRVWSNGPAFDISILCAAFECYGIKRPWICWQERCVRTALEQAGYEKGSVSWIENGPKHRALNDARHEARKLFYSGALGEVSMAMKRLRQRGPGWEGGAK